MMPFRLRLERIGVERRCVILNIEVMQPIELAQHKARPKTGSFPFTKIVIDPSGALFELAPRREQPAIMSKIVNPNLESILC